MLHVDIESDGTCARCGNYTCAACTTSLLRPICKTCRRLQDDKPKVRQLGALGIVLAIHGAALVLGSILMVAMTGAAAWLESNALVHRSSGNDWSAMTFSLVAVVAAGVTQLVSGWRLRQRRGLGLALFAAAFSWATVSTCVCAPTGLALGAWAMWVLLDRDVIDVLEDPGS